MKIRVKFEFPNVTKDSIYKVVKENESYFWFMNNLNEEVAVAKGCCEIIKEVESMKELTFREVIANIKEGEVWESPFKKIVCNKVGDIAIEEDNSEDLLYFDKNTIYKLVRQEYTFQEALEVLENGEEIESVVSGFKYSKEGEYIRTCDENYICIDTTAEEETLFMLTEIKGNWYINK